MKKQIFKRVTMALLLSASLASAGGMFSIGHKNFGFTVGQDSAYGNNYSVLGLNAHYFVADNISVGASYSLWLGDNPTISQLTVPITYHIPLSMPFRPYVGAFYSHTFMGDNGHGVEYDDYDSYGGRVGMSMITSPNSYVSFGWVQEVYDDGINKESRGYPEVSGGISF
ncbi:MAG: hypothetical protein KAG56_02820 [Sulfurovaceae bacterium]|nr:hypothetical protein [Sulfurovaceae bacterium]